MIQYEYSRTSLEWLRYKYKTVVERFDYFDYEDEIFVDTIVIRDVYRGQGYGTSFMKDLCAHADEKRKIISLIPSNNLGTSLKILERFYKKFNFKYGKETYDNHTMIRGYVKTNKI